MPPGQQVSWPKNRRRPEVSAELVDVALARLAERSLLAVSVDGKTVMAQRLVVHMVRDQLSRRGRLVAVCRAAASVLDMRAAALAGSPDRSAIRDILVQVAALRENMAGSAAEDDDELARTLLSLRFWALYDLNELGDSRRGHRDRQAAGSGLPARAGSRPPGHPDGAEQPRRRVPGGGPGRRGDPAVRAEPGGPGAAAGARTPRRRDHAEQPRCRVPGGGPGRRGDPAARADPGSPGTAARGRPPTR